MGTNRTTSVARSVNNGARSEEIIVRPNGNGDTHNSQAGKAIKGRKGAAKSLSLLDSPIPTE